MLAGWLLAGAYFRGYEQVYGGRLKPSHFGTALPLMDFSIDSPTSRNYEFPPSERGM
jgi:hypothetical protein